MVGIERLKEDLTVIGKVAAKVDKALEDGKVSITEGVGLAFSLPDLIGVAKTMKEAYAELKDLTSPEKDELVEHFKAEFDLANDKAEAAVEKIVELGVNIADSLGLFKDE